jgi:hypothetical protein
MGQRVVQSTVGQTPDDEVDDEDAPGDPTPVVAQGEKPWLCGREQDRTAKLPMKITAATMSGQSVGCSQCRQRSALAIVLSVIFASSSPHPRRHQRGKQPATLARRASSAWATHGLNNDDHRFPSRLRCVIRRRCRGSGSGTSAHAVV